MALDRAGEIIQFAAEEGERCWPQVVEALRDALSRYVRADGVWAPASPCFVNARRTR